MTISVQMRINASQKSKTSTRAARLFAVILGSDGSHGTIPDGFGTSNDKGFGTNPRRYRIPGISRPGTQNPVPAKSARVRASLSVLFCYQ
jgi:hypothetical protein